MIAERGYRGATLAAVADRVGLTQQGLMHHFPTKEALLVAVLAARDQWDMASAALHGRPAAGRRPAGRVQRDPARARAGVHRAVGGQRHRRAPGPGVLPERYAQVRAWPPARWSAATATGCRAGSHPTGGDAARRRDGRPAGAVAARPPRSTCPPSSPRSCGHCARPRRHRITPAGNSAASPAGCRRGPCSTARRSGHR